MNATETLLDFAQSIEKVLGTEETLLLLSKLAEFAKTCPETLNELKDVVADNPQVFKDLLTPKGVADAKEMIEIVKNFMPSM